MIACTIAGDGSVICSSYSPSNWIFSTIEVPFNPFVTGYDGLHPVSGNREFGYIQNSNGTYTFYTRGVDRITGAIDDVVVRNLKTNPFDAPDALWNSFNNGIYNYTLSNSGTASNPTTTPNIIYRPKWDKVKEVLRGIRPVSDLNCK